MNLWPESDHWEHFNPTTEYIIKIAFTKLFFSFFKFLYTYTYTDVLVVTCCDINQVSGGGWVGNFEKQIKVSKQLFVTRQILCLQITLKIFTSNLFASVGVGTVNHRLVYCENACADCVGFSDVD